MLGSAKLGDEKAILRGIYDEKARIEDSPSTFERLNVPAVIFPDGVGSPRLSSPSEAKHLQPLRHSKQCIFLIDVIVESNTVRSHKWSEIPLEKPFHQQSKFDLACCSGCHRSVQREKPRQEEALTVCLSASPNVSKKDETLSRPP